MKDPILTIFLDNRQIPGHPELETDFTIDDNFIALSKAQAHRLRRVLHDMESVLKKLAGEPDTTN